MFALVDCNNFYVSCERVFQPHLRDKPIVVLSNNDGCIISRSNEVKKLGLKLGEPYFESKAFLRKHNIIVFSSNYPLYGDLSHRVMDTLAHFVPDLEVYSIDEAFLDLSLVRQTELDDFGEHIKHAVYQQTGIPVSVGIGPSKTLAKAANELAKKDPEYKRIGVANLHNHPHIDEYLARIEVQDVWGIGRQYTKLLKQNNIYTARDLKYTNETWTKKHMTIMGKRCVFELRGIPCFKLEDAPPAKKAIASTRSFGRPVETRRELEEVVATYVTRAAEKLRADDSITSHVHIFIMTNRYKSEEPQYTCNTMVRFSIPTSNTVEIVKYASAGLNAIYRPGYRYKKAGVMFTNIIPAYATQENLFLKRKNARERKLMRVVDRINRMWGHDSIQLAAAGIKKSWSMRQSMKSSSFTTNWDQLPIARGD